MLIKSSASPVFTNTYKAKYTSPHLIKRNMHSMSGSPCCYYHQQKCICFPSPSVKCALCLWSKLTGKKNIFPVKSLWTGLGVVPASPHLSAFWSALRSARGGWFLSRAWWPCGSELHSAVSEPFPTSYFPPRNSQSARDKGPHILHYKQSLSVAACDIYNDKTRRSWQISHLAGLLCISGSWGTGAEHTGIQLLTNC